MLSNIFAVSAEHGRDCHQFKYKTNMTKQSFQGVQTAVFICFSFDIYI